MALSTVLGRSGADSSAWHCRYARGPSQRQRPRSYLQVSRRDAFCGIFSSLQLHLAICGRGRWMTWQIYTLELTRSGVEKRDIQAGMSPAGEQGCYIPAMARTPVRLSQEKYQLGLKEPQRCAAAACRLI
jgi:hypothetical protein